MAYGHHGWTNHSLSCRCKHLDELFEEPLHVILAGVCGDMADRDWSTYGHPAPTAIDDPHSYFSLIHCSIALDEYLDLGSQVKSI